MKNVLKGFANQMLYGGDVSKKTMQEDLNQFDPMVYTTDYPDVLEGFDRERELNNIAVLIASMVIGGAENQEMERAIKHSMVIIDAKKYHLDWRQSEHDFGIMHLAIKYRAMKDSR